MTIAVLGLGPMGRGIARNLARAGSAPLVWNRSPVAVESLKAPGARPVSSIAEAAAETVLSVLPDVDQLRAATGAEIWAAWSRRGARRVVVMSTTSPGKIRELERELAPFGLAVADAPMSGGEAGAESGTLSIMLGAHEEDWEVLRADFEPVASRIERFGAPGAGSIAKLCNQIVVAGTLSSLAESFALAERAGIDTRALARILENGLAASAVLTTKRERLLSHDYAPSGSAVNQLKDLRYLESLAVELGAQTPIVDAITPLFAAAVEEGSGAMDHSVVLEQLRKGLRSEERRPGSVEDGS